LLCGAALGLLHPGTRAQAAPYQLGLTPYLSPTAMVAAFRPLREHLEARLGRAVETRTARDLPTMVVNTRRGDHDVALLPAQLARLATIDWGFTTLAGTLSRIRVLILVQRGSPVRGAADLRGLKLGAFDQVSIVGATALAWMRAQRLAAGRDYVFLAQPSVSSGMFALARGDIDALAIASSQVAALPADTLRDDRVLAEIGDVPAPMYVARQGLLPAEITAWRAALLSFEPLAAAGATVANARLHVVPAPALQQLDPLADEARRLLTPMSR
jgi:ABC-type phosphate/phosphonate transport system substrate-binding protein